MESKFVKITQSPYQEFPFAITVKVSYTEEKTYFCKEVPVANENYSKLISMTNEVAILYSPGFGSGWFSSNTQFGQQIVKDSRIIRYRFEKNFYDLEFNEFMTHVIRFQELPYDGGWEQLSLAFVPDGVPYEIAEYDGAEFFVVFDFDFWKAYFFLLIFFILIKIIF